MNFIQMIQVIRVRASRQKGKNIMSATRVMMQKRSERLRRCSHRLRPLLKSETSIPDLATQFLDPGVHHVFADVVNAGPIKVETN